ncbi:MAG: YihY/virulence factor BrkB family protein [Acidimicrobiales bacterium]
MKTWADLLTRFDRFQQHKPVLAFPIAVVKKFGDDRGGQLAAVISYYAFFSLFPLLVLLTTIAGFVLSNNGELRRELLDTVLRQFPSIGEELALEINRLDGSVLVLVIGSLGLLWSGLGALQATQHAMNTIWNIPIKLRASFLVVHLRAIGALAVLGLGFLTTTVLANLRPEAAGVTGALFTVLGLFGSLALSCAMFIGIFVVLTERQLSWRDVILGAIVGSLGWTAIHILGGWYVDRVLSSASATYGSFAMVIGLLSWLYLQAQVLLLAAEINVVKVAHLWPRGLRSEALTGADRSSLTRTAQVEERIPGETVNVELPTQDKQARDTG